MDVKFALEAMGNLIFFKYLKIDQEDDNRDVVGKVRISSRYYQ